MVTTGAFPTDKDIYQFAAQQHSAVGIRTTINVIQFAEWPDRWYGRKKGPEGGMGFDDIFANSCHNYNSIPFDAYPNLSRAKDLPSHCDPEESALLTAASQEFDVEKRRKLIQELMVLKRNWWAPGGGVARRAAVSTLAIGHSVGLSIHESDFNPVASAGPLCPRNRTLERVWC